MWIRSYSETFQDIKREDIWNLWTNINRWHEWNDGIEYCRIMQPFEIGNCFTLKPKGAPAMTIQLVKIEQGYKFTDCTKFFGAKMYGTHEIHETEDGIKLTVTMKVTGVLKFLWGKLVAQKIIDTSPHQIYTLVGMAKNGNNK